MNSQLPLQAEIARGAILSPCGRYRYNLWRQWSDGPTMAVIGCNPSTADAHLDDPTIRRCVRFAADSGHGKLVMLNLFAWRATDVRELASAPQPYGGREAGEYLEREVMAAKTVVCAWGSTKKLPPALREWPHTVAQELVLRGVHLHVLALTEAGDPAHPLYLPASCRPVPWSVPHA